MSMTDWAKREVEIACKREAPDRKEGEWDYGCACYESALKAYLSLMEDNHSGASFGFTAGILKRLLEAKPLTPIEDVPEMWEMAFSVNGTVSYQCKRMSSLFKDIAPDGTVKFHDHERYYCEDVNSGMTYHCSLEGRLLDELYPITMPYYPPLGSYVFKTAELLTDRKNGDFDTKQIYELTLPDGTIVDINRYFAESENGWREISYSEYAERVEADRKRRANDAGQ